MGTTMISLKSIVDKLYNLEDLSYQESYQLFDYFIKGQIELPLQTSILIALKLKKRNFDRNSSCSRSFI